MCGLARPGLAWLEEGEFVSCSSHLLKTPQNFPLRLPLAAAGPVQRSSNACLRACLIEWWWVIATCSPLSNRRRARRRRPRPQRRSELPDGLPANFDGTSQVAPSTSLPLLLHPLSPCVLTRLSGQDGRWSGSCVLRCVYGRGWRLSQRRQTKHCA